MVIEQGRLHLAPDILRIVDNLGLTYKEMLPGQTLTIWAKDAVNGERCSFLLEVASVRQVEGRQDLMTATFRYLEGDFNFYNGDDVQGKPIKLAPGTLMETGLDGTLIPQTDIRMMYFGGIGLGRDHSFEYVEGRDKSVVAHSLDAIDVAAPALDWQDPDLEEHFEKIKQTKTRVAEREEHNSHAQENNLKDFISEKFSSHPKFGEIQEKLRDFSPNGKIVIASYLAHALEDGVFDKAWEIFNRACIQRFDYQHPGVRGDIDIMATNRQMLMQMTREAGIKWPRPEVQEPVVNQDGPAPGEVTSIKLGDDPELRTKLDRKLAEYKSRQVKWREEDPYAARRARSKEAILTEVLENGEVTVQSLKTKFSREPWFNLDDFEKDMWVINEYCATGGRGRVAGGTGLR